ncbi:hypothetical protein LWF15_03700 [Kineosporia rhizophila]|uniref:hypothetical protein n=1 Tax=Kineosporia rhizophila TaxID=84633 RepID=UPI000A8F9B57|nr:hypothetical protein [Kineosporia rhizophila]MCE0534603.1 hypothetical protein [Kineosporia rhizophila]
MHLVGQLLLRAAVTAISAGFTLFLWFVFLVFFSGDWFHGVSAMCRNGVPDYPPMKERLFPLSQACVYTDGRTEELVPWIANPVIALAGALTLYCLFRCLRTVNEMVRAVAGYARSLRA